MNQSIRPELNGRILKLEDGKVAIVVNGTARIFENEAVFRNLFGEGKLVTADSIDGVPIGPVLNEGTCLIRSIGGLDIFLVSGLPQTYRHLITSYDKFVMYGFNLDKVEEIPWLVLQAVPVGENI